MKLRFWIALGAELLLFGSLNFFDDWTLEGMPVKFVAAAMLCGIAYFVAVAKFPTGVRFQAAVFWVR